jgi:hypothetical protein
MMDKAYNPSYWGGRDLEDHDSRPAMDKTKKVHKPPSQSITG